MAAADNNARPEPTDADRAQVERLLDALRAGQDVRRRKVRRLRAAVRVRAYENPLKFQIALDRLMGELGESSNPGS
jgi:hypothetical protein